MDATGPRRSRGAGADGAPRTCGDWPALPGCIPCFVRSLVAQRIATGAGQAQATRIRRHRKRKLPEARKITSAPGRAALRFRRSPRILNHGSHGSTRMVLRANLLLIRVNPCHLTSGPSPASPPVVVKIPGAAHPSRGSHPGPKRIKSSAHAGHARAGREQVIRSRGKHPE